MMQEIGSNFWLDPNEKYIERQVDPSAFHCVGEDYVWLSTGRSAIRFVLQNLKKERKDLPKTALIPSFTCYTVAEPFHEEGYFVETIPVNTMLQYNADEILSRVKNKRVGVVLLHQYFGFQSIPRGSDLIRNLKKYGVIIIEDRTQCLYSDFDILGADFTVASIRKWGGMPDGGFAVREKGEFLDKPFKQDDALEQAKERACYAKYRYLFHGEGEKKRYLQQYRTAEDILDAQDGYYRISSLSLAVQANMNLKLLREKRRKNYSVLLNGLCNCRTVEPVFQELPESVVPLYFPIAVQSREALQAFLRDHQIYAPIVWPKPEFLNEVSQSEDYLYRHLLCIPVDQRYGTDDMDRIVDTIRAFE